MAIDTRVAFDHSNPDFLGYCSWKNRVARQEGCGLPLYTDIVRQYCEENSKPQQQKRKPAGTRDNFMRVPVQANDQSSKNRHLRLVVNNA